MCQKLLQTQTSTALSSPFPASNSSFMLVILIKALTVSRMGGSVKAAQASVCSANCVQFQDLLENIVLSCNVFLGLQA